MRKRNRLVWKNSSKVATHQIRQCQQGASTTIHILRTYSEILENLTCLRPWGRKICAHTVPVSTMVGFLPTLHKPLQIDLLPYRSNGTLDPSRVSLVLHLPVPCTRQPSSCATPTSNPLMPMFGPMDSMLLWTMRKRKKMRRPEDFLVYNDWLCIEFNNFFVDTWTSSLCTLFHFTLPKNLKLHEASLHEKNNEVMYFTKTSLHLTHVY